MATKAPCKEQTGSVPGHPSEWVWTTNSEKQFLNRLGTHSKPDSHYRALSREKLLTRYLAAAKKRTHWGIMDKAQVLAHARHCLAVAEKESG